MRDMNETTHYVSPLRREQSDQTRSRIVDAALDLIVGGVEGLTMQEVAKAAGVALRTVFRHFPTRDDLLDATWQAMQIRMGETPELETLDELIGFLPELFGRYGAMEDQIRGAMFAQTFVSSRQRLGSDRARKVRRAVAAQFTGGDERSRAMAASAAYTLTVPLVSIVLKEAFGLSSSEAARASAWAIRALAAAYAEDPEALNSETLKP
ncbi:TetR/AcrR family transcriptional regulator [Brevundimonas sp.]|uniref:TetR/AcrR family transcriptional regulator n=1 Tax=Brevundimonas sp. TaxID=1871086 RepID=UPI00121C5694|nr:TetR/AcrR family transcriptional regulator [Brevundimonas sp.]TAJ59200.1 MAG: TetR/AcrR family transcriptional regulator [Brevundimonas sp.]